MQLLLLVLLPLIQSYVVHEWGTYTSCQGSNGKILAGLHHGEVADLPDFVHSRADSYTHEMWEAARNKLARNDEKRGIVPPSLRPDTPVGCGFCEVMDWIPVAGAETEVTQKLETPVIYFYSDKKINDVNVAVDFPQGIITEVYPKTSINFPETGKVESTSNGHAEWDVHVQPRGARLSVPPVDPQNIWAPSRRVSANQIQSKNENPENEHHIFYRGLGRFDGPVSIKSTQKELIIENNENEAIPAVWVLVSDGNNKGMIRSLGSIPAKSKVATSLSNGRFNLFNHSESMDMSIYLLDAGVKLEIELVKSGLYSLEARAMVDTWSSNYFKTYGTRVLYVAPKSFPDTLLPWSIIPSPEESVRTYVGRIEVILQAEEIEFKSIGMRLVQDQYTPSQAALKNSDYKYIQQLGRFAEPKLRRVVGNEVNKQQLEDFILRELTF